MRITAAQKAAWANIGRTSIGLDHRQTTPEEARANAAAYDAAKRRHTRPTAAQRRWEEATGPGHGRNWI